MQVNLNPQQRQAMAGVGVAVGIMGLLWGVSRMMRQKTVKPKAAPQAEAPKAEKPDGSLDRAALMREMASKGGKKSAERRKAKAAQQAAPVAA